MQQDKLIIKNKVFIAEINFSKKLVCTQWTGDITFKTGSQYVNLVWRRPDTREFNECIDFREAGDVSLSSDEIRFIAEEAAEIAKNWKPTKVAFIVPNDLIFGLGRMYSTMRELFSSGSREVQVFKDAETAASWLENSEKPDEKKR